MRLLVYTKFISNNCASFHLWWEQSLVKHQAVSKYYENDCSFVLYSFLNFCQNQGFCSYKIVPIKKECNSKYMITLTQITNPGIFSFITVLVFKLLSRKVLFTNREDNRSRLKSRLLFKKIANYYKITKSWNVKFFGYFWNT